MIIRIYPQVTLKASFNRTGRSFSTTDYADDTDFKGIAAASRRFSGISQIRQAAFRDFTDSTGGFQGFHRFGRRLSGTVIAALAAEIHKNLCNITPVRSQNLFNLRNLWLLK